MPGLYGIVDFGREPDQDLFERLGLKISPAKANQPIFKSGPCRLGFKSLGIVDYPCQPFFGGKSNLALFVWGEIFNSHVEGRAFAEHIFKLYLDNKLDQLRNINGFFSLALWDNHRQTLVLTSDLQGTRPLYYFRDKARFIFGPNPFDLAALLDLKKLNHSTLAEFLAFGIIYGAHSWIEGVTKLRYGQYLRFAQGGFDTIKYFRPEFKAETYSIEKTIDIILEKLKEAALKMARGKTALSLSGGSDSRLLAAIFNSEGLSIPAFTYGGPDGLDLQIASEVADRFGMRHQALLIDPEFLKAHLHEAVYNSAGHISALNFHGISTRHRVKEFADICLSGLCGNDILGYPSPTIFKLSLIKNRKSFQKALFKYFNHGFSVEEVRNLLGADFNEDVVFDTIVRLEDDYHQASNLATLAAINHFELNGQSSQAGFWLENDTLEFRDPFSDLEVVKLNFSIPVQYKLMARLSRNIWKKHFPEVAGIEYQRTGLPLNASLVSILAKVIGDRIGGGKRAAGILDYRQLYMQQSSWLHEILLSDNSLSSEKFDRTILERILDEHKKGSHDNSARIATLLTIEQVLKLLK